MSELGKRIGRVLRREVTGGLGFGAARSEKPRAMLLAVLASSAEDASAAIASGADVAIFDGLAAAEAARAVGGVEKARTGVRLARFDEAGAAALKEAGCDFVISPIDGTDSAAVDTESMGQVLVATAEISDTTLRALPPLGLDALYVDRAPGAMTLAQQLELVRISSFAGTPLMVRIEAAASVSELRVLRDSGAGVVVAPAGTSGEQVKALVEALKAVPAAKKSSKGGEMAIVPRTSQAASSEDEEEGGDDE
jgi:hypothetical protein